MRQDLHQSPYVPTNIPGVYLGAGMAALLKKLEMGEGGEVEEYPMA